MARAGSVPTPVRLRAKQAADLLAKAAGLLGNHSSVMSKACSACFWWRTAHKQRIPYAQCAHILQSSIHLQSAYDAGTVLNHHRHAQAQLRRQRACCRRCVQYAVAASTEQAVVQPAESVAAEDISVDSVDAESAQLLEWPAVCAQVAAFTSTPAAAERVLSSGLPLAASLVRAALLLAVQACLLCKCMVELCALLPCSQAVAGRTANSSSVKFGTGRAAVTVCRRGVIRARCCPCRRTASSCCVASRCRPRCTPQL